MDDVDWEWVRSFVAVAEAGSMRAAAERTGASQPTLSRHVQRLEEALGLALFDRRGRGLALTPRGTALFEAAARVRAEMDRFRRQALGLGEEVAGSVRVTATWAMGLTLLPEWIAAMRDRAPHVTIDLVLDDSEVNLLTREAEVAVRMFRPAQLDLVCRACGRADLGFYASPRYLARRGTPASRAEVRQHDLVGFDRRTIALEHAARAGHALSRDGFVFRSDAMPAQLEAARAGLGLATTFTWLPDGPDLVRVLPEVVVSSQEVWLVAHAEVHHNPRVRLVWRELGDFLERRLSPAGGGA